MIHDHHMFTYFHQRPTAASRSDIPPSPTSGSVRVDQGMQALVMATDSSGRLNEEDETSRLTGDGFVSSDRFGEEEHPSSPKQRVLCFFFGGWL